VRLRRADPLTKGVAGLRHRFDQGQRKLDRDGIQAAYPFGFGLGYTTFDLRDLRVGPIDGERFEATVTVTNTGSRAGRHVVQVYAHQPDKTHQSIRALVGFRSIDVKPGEGLNVTVDCSTRPLLRWTGGRLQLEPGTVVIEAAAHSGDPQALSTTLDTPRTD
jgi:beta-glucosidase